MKIPWGMVVVAEHPFAESFPDRTVAANEKNSVCTHPECGMPILWTLNEKGKKEPFDLTAKPKDGKLVSHFAICAHAKKFRKPRTKKG